MPLEIRELLIKTSISNESDEQKASPSAVQDGSSNATDAIVAACLEQVLAILKEKQER
ncbi:MAG: DUF5908 family protein [Crocosphaera sp.]|nr:DUF5908 family protein [Crocosphaera sp.]